MAKQKNRPKKALTQEGHYITGTAIGMLGVIIFYSLLCFVHLPPALEVVALLYFFFHSGPAVILCLISAVNFSEDTWDTVPWYDSWQEWAVFWMFLPLVVARRVMDYLQEVMYEDEEQ